MRRQVILMSEEVRAIQCRSCGGAMYSDQKTASYVCAFCGSSVPWREEAEFWASPITFRHKPVQVIDGAMKLGHVEVMSAVNCTAPSRSRQRCKNRSDKSCADCSDSALDTLRSARHVRMICQGSGCCDEDLCSDPKKLDPISLTFGCQVTSLRAAAAFLVPITACCPVQKASTSCAADSLHRPHILMKNLKMKPCSLFLL